MKKYRVREIMLPYDAAVPLNPWVVADDRITRAIRKMIDWDVHAIVVIRRNRPIGMIRMEDALEEIGLEPN